MSGALSPDGKWMWDGTEWIPAPPSEVENNTPSNDSIPETPAELSYTPTAPPSKGASAGTFWGHSEDLSGYTKSPTATSKLTITNQINPFAIEVISKKQFPTASIRFKFTNPSSGISHGIKIVNGLRSFKAETDSGEKVGKIKMKGFTIFSGASGNITLHDGGIFRVDMKIKPFSGIDKKSLTLTDLANGTVFRTY